MMLNNNHKFLKFSFSLFLLILIPTYWKTYGPQNFLWFCDINLFLTVCALWFSSSLLLSIVIIGFLPVELLWNVDFILKLVGDCAPFGIVSYMFDPQISVFMRSLSLFHVVIPFVCFWALFRWGYEKQALYYALIIVPSIIIATYFFTDPKLNINWVFSPIVHQWENISVLIWLSLLIAFFVLIIVGMHHVLKRMFYQKNCDIT